MAGQQGDMQKPAMFVGQTTEMRAVVEAIDYESRLVTLRKDDGSVVTFTASPDVRNLDQAQPGDVLHVEYSESLRIQVAASADFEPAAGEMVSVTRSEEGEKPSMIAVDTTMLIARVVAIDVDAMTYKLQFPDGAIYEYEAMVRENLEAADVGDMVAIEITESVIAVVLGVDPAE